jgi:hypothetical protein
LLLGDRKTFRHAHDLAHACVAEQVRMDRSRLTRFRDLADKRLHPFEKASSYPGSSQ